MASLQVLLARSERARAVLVAWLGTFGVILATWTLFASQNLIYAFASLGGSAVIVFGMPDSVMAQPRSLFGGHAIGALTGIGFLHAFGTGPVALAAAVATALALMQLLDAIHSPAGADPLIVMVGATSLSTAVVELAFGLLLLWLGAIVMLNLFAVRPYGRRLPLIGSAATSLGRRGDALFAGGARTDGRPADGA